MRQIKRNARRDELKAWSKLARRAHLRPFYHWDRYQDLKDSDDPEKRKIAAKHLDLYHIGMRRRQGLRR